MGAVISVFALRTDQVGISKRQRTARRDQCMHTTHHPGRRGAEWHRQQMKVGTAFHVAHRRAASPMTRLPTETSLVAIGTGTSYT